MMRCHRFGGHAAPVLFALAILNLVAASPTRANSALSIGGLGEPSLEESARLRSLGGAGAAEHGPSSFSMVNPASIAEAKNLTLEATMLVTRRSITSTSNGSESANEGAFPSIRMVVRLPGALILGGSYFVGTNGEFEIDRAESAGTASHLHVDGTGGINYIRATLARRVLRDFRAGVDLDFIGGSYREEWRRTFSDPSLSQARDTLEVDWDRLHRWRFGLQYVRSGFSIGAAYETERHVPVTYNQRTAGSQVQSKGHTLQLPAGFTAGFSVSLGARARAVGQYRRQDWNNESLVSDLVDFRAEQRYSIGFERSAGEFGGLLDRLPIRIGATYLNWPDLLPLAGATDVTGGTAHIDEWAVSVGTGLLTPDKGGSFDLSLEGGKRGNQDELGLSETFFRLALSVRVTDETWK